jgi:hypothetical protein
MTRAESRQRCGCSFRGGGTAVAASEVLLVDGNHDDAEALAVARAGSRAGPVPLGSTAPRQAGSSARSDRDRKTAART